MWKPKLTFDEVLSGKTLGDVEHLRDYAKVPCPECDGLKSPVSRVCFDCAHRRPVRHRIDIVRALWYQGLGIKEIAAELGCRVDVVQDALRRMHEQDEELPIQVKRR